MSANQSKNCCGVCTGRVGCKVRDAAGVGVPERDGGSKDLLDLLSFICGELGREGPASAI